MYGAYLYGIGLLCQKTQVLRIWGSKMALAEPIVCILNILRYSLRIWNGRIKEGKLEDRDYSGSNKEWIKI